MCQRLRKILELVVHFKIYEKLIDEYGHCLLLPLLLLIIIIIIIFIIIIVIIIIVVIVIIIILITGREGSISDGVIKILH